MKYSIGSDGTVGPESKEFLLKYGSYFHTTRDDFLDNGVFLVLVQQEDILLLDTCRIKVWIISIHLEY